MTRDAGHETSVGSACRYRSLDTPSSDYGRVGLGGYRAAEGSLDRAQSGVPGVSRGALRLKFGSRGEAQGHEG